ncbi:MAG: Hsp70 family protein [Anaerolineae bacterium]
MLTIGVDFGTTNCSASVWRNGRSELIPLENGRTLLPSTICITKDHAVTFGRAAIEQYLELTRDTPIRYRFTDLRELTSVFADESEELVQSDDELVVVSDVGEEEDLERPARLFQSLKTGLRDPYFQGTTVFGRYYAMEELVALVLGHIRECAERHLGEPVRAAVIGRPVSYAPADRPQSVSPEYIDQIAHERMLAAARLAGFTHAALELEPVAAARHLRADLPPHSRALVFDFGGGTLDIAIAQGMDEASPDIVATHGIPLGGDDLDSAIMRHAVLRYFGEGTTLGPKHLPLPPNVLDPLLHWQTMSLLATPAQAAHLAAIKRQSNAPQTIENLQTLLRKGLGFKLFQLIEAAKIHLSSEPSATISLHAGNLHIDAEITRQGFVSAITDHLSSIEKALGDALASAQLEPQDVDAVLMTGGSSQVPVVQAVVRRIFGADKVCIADPFTSISAGLGIVAAEDDIVQSVEDAVSEATAARLRAEAVTIGETVAFTRGHQTVEGIVVRRAGGRLHDAILVIEFWDQEIEQFVSTMRHETKVTRIKAPR